MSGKTFLALAALTMTCLAHVGVGTAAARDAPLLERPGVWSLPALGSSGSGLQSGLQDSVEERRAEFRLPKGARQGPRTWYLMRLRFKITFDKAGGPGFAFISGLTNGRAAAQVELMREPNHNRIRVRTLNYIRGGAQRWVSRRSVEVGLTNYLQYSGVRAGLNTFAVKVEQTPGVKIESFSVLLDSGIIVTRTGPAALAVSLERHRFSITVGDEFDVRYTVRNDGDRPALNIEVTPEHPRALELIGEADYERRILRGTMSDSFRFRARAPGIYRAALFVSSGSNHPAVEFEVRVDPPASEWARAGTLASRAAGALLLIGGAVSLWPLRRSRT